MEQELTHPSPGTKRGGDSGTGQTMGNTHDQCKSRTAFSPPGTKGAGSGHCALDPGSGRLCCDTEAGEGSGSRKLLFSGCRRHAHLEGPDALPLPRALETSTHGPPPCHASDRMVRCSGRRGPFGS